MQAAKRNLQDFECGRCEDVVRAEPEETNIEPFYILLWAAYAPSIYAAYKSEKKARPWI